MVLTGQIPWGASLSLQPSALGIPETPASAPGRITGSLSWATALHLVDTQLWCQGKTSGLELIKNCLMALIRHLSYWLWTAVPG